MHDEVNIPSKKWKCSILHKRCPFFSAEQTVRRWTPLGGLGLPAKIVAKFSVMQMLSRDTFDSITKKESLIATFVRENFTQSSCSRTTLDCSRQMWGWSDGGSPQSDLGWLRSLTNHQHPWLARNVLSGQRNVDFKIECMHYFYSLLCTPLGQCV